jgi:hypothetical protein
LRYKKFHEACLKPGFDDLVNVWKKHWHGTKKDAALIRKIGAQDELNYYCDHRFPDRKDYDKRVACFAAVTDHSYEAVRKRKWNHERGGYEKLTGQERYYLANNRK